MRDEQALIAAIQASGHSVFAPSAAHRWMQCPASLRASLAIKAEQMDEDGTPLSGSNFFSVQGTAAHHVAELWLRRGMPPDELRNTKFTRDGIEVDIDDEMFTEVERYVAWCEELGEGFRAVETRVTFGSLFPLPDQGGTCDHMHYRLSAGRLTITDLKYGKGVRVYAKNNKQELLYTVGAMAHLADLYGDDEFASNLHEIVLRIAQPRLDHFDVWTIGPKEIAEFVRDVQEKAAIAWAPNAPFNPDPKACRFCPVKGSCAALRDELQHMADDVFGIEETLQGTGDGGKRDLTQEWTVDTALLDTASMSELLRWRPTIESMFATIEAELLRRAEGGEEVPDFKIVEGRSRREWKNGEKAAAEWLDFLGLSSEEIWTRKIISPHQAELALRAKRVASKRGLKAEVTSVAGPRTLAPTLDPRSKLVGAADVFEPVVEDDTDLS